MLKTLYFDCSSGICGNMVLGALTDILGDDMYLIHELEKLNVDGYKVEISKKLSHGITGTYVNVIVDGVDEYGHVHYLNSDNHNEHEHNDAHFHHEHRNLADVNKIIDDSDLDNRVKDLAKRIFLRVAMAESKVHGKSLEDVHFHEVGAIDSIVDIVGTAILVCKINPDKIISSVVNEGHGFIECAHGTMSVPVPATSEIFANSKVKFRQIDVDTELVTPTGAAIIAELADDFRTIPEMTVSKVGWGAGTKELTIPNILKVYLGDFEESGNPSKFNMYVIETNIDDSTGEELGYAMEKLFANGALDVFYTSIFMKKNRPAYRLEVICKEQDLVKLQNVIFKETTTIGVRYYKVDRTELTREFVEVDTKYGKIKAKKVVIPNGDIFVYPEYDSLRDCAVKNGIAIKELYKLF